MNYFTSGKESQRNSSHFGQKNIENGQFGVELWHFLVSSWNMVSYGTIWYYMVPYGTVPYGTIGYHMVPYGTLWYPRVPYSALCYLWHHRIPYKPPSPPQPWYAHLSMINDDPSRRHASEKSGTWCVTYAVSMFSCVFHGFRGVPQNA